MIVPIVNDKNLVEEYIAIRQDITDMHNQEQYLKKRIKMEVEKNLQETKYATIGKMAAGITHEINTPLTFIKGNVEMMMADIENLDDSCKEKEYLIEDAKTIRDGTNRIANIVEAMREMASQSKEKIESNSVYETLITALTLSYSKSKQVSKIYIEDDLFEIGMSHKESNYRAMIQKQRVEQVWVIIINNAIDALKQIDDYETRELRITIQESQKNIVVRFKDNGGGIDESVLPKIFDPFESLKTEGGIGIGLNVAKKIIDEHNGEIKASNEDGGALFEVCLPKCL